MMDMTSQADPVFKFKKQLVLWLLSGCFLVFGMVVVGGITRLTGSGLSITEWDVVTGTIPPLSDEAWQMEFEKYKLIPQYSQVNAHFNIEDFKFIYFWEYIHRLFGRLIGMVFVIGLIYFLIKRAVPRTLMPSLIFMFILGGIQGFLGWYMVKSGLTQNVRVSHLRLATHLTFAFITFGYIFSVALSQIYNRRTDNAGSLAPYRAAAWLFLVLLVLQVVFGAFVAGTKAGWTYNTWPSMEGEFVPDSVPFSWEKDGWASLYNNLASIQFIHRMLAYLLVVYVVFFAIRIFRLPQLDFAQRRAVTYLLTGVFFQVVLGIATLVLMVPLWMGVAHQAMAFVLFGAVIFLIYRLKYGPETSRS